MNNKVNDNNTLIEGYITAANKAIRESGQDYWTAEHDDALQVTLIRLWKKYRVAPEGGASRREPIPLSKVEFIELAERHFRLDLRQIRHQATASGSTLRDGEHQKGPLSEAAERELRRELWIPTNMPLTEEWLLKEVARKKRCKSYSLDAEVLNQDGESITSHLAEEASEIEAANTDADTAIEWLRELLEELPPGSRMRALVVAFVTSWREGDGCKNWTAAANRLGITRRVAEREKRKLASIIASNPLASVALARVKENAGRGAKLLR